MSERLGVAEMRANANLVIRGQRAILVPYKTEHVVAYHQWMVRSLQCLWCAAIVCAPFC